MAGSTSGQTFVNRSAQEHLMYLQEKVNPILEALVTAVLLERPEEPDFFMLKWLCEQTKSLDGADQGQRSASTAEEIEAVRAEIERVKERKAQLEARKNQAAGQPVGAQVDGEAQAAPEIPTKADNDEDEDEDDDDDDLGEEGPDDIPPPPVKMNRGQRRSVSAEAFGAFNQRSEDWEAPVYDKTAEQKSRIEKCLENSFLFNALEKQEMDTLVLAFKEAKVQAGDRVIQQGDDGESMYLLETGVVDCLKMIEGEEKVVKTCNGGEVFGELALLYNCPRAASVVAREEATLWELDRETFNRIVKDAASKKREQYTEFLKKVPLLKNVDAYECMTMADALKVEAHEAQDTQVIKLGDLGDKFYIVLEGECVAKTEVSPGIEQIVMTHKVGDYFGELSLIKNQPRAANVYTTMPDTKLLWMNRSTFKRLLGPIEEILRREAVGRYESKSAPGSPSA